jgi:NADH-quinone oxidoreductase subunit L
MMGIFMSFVAALTAFYMFRLYYLIFWGKSHYEEQLAAYSAGKEAHEPHKPHEAPATMTIPLIILATITVFSGFIPFGEFISSNGEAYSIHLNYTVATVSVLLAVAGIALATVMYKSGESKLTVAINKSMRGLISAAYHRFYMDELWLFVTKKIIFNCISRPIAWFDRHIIDGTMDLMATITQKLGNFVRPMQSGNVQSYSVWFLSGALFIILILIYFA